MLANGEVIGGERGHGEGRIVPGNGGRRLAAHEAGQVKGERRRGALLDGLARVGCGKRGLGDRPRDLLGVSRAVFPGIAIIGRRHGNVGAGVACLDGARQRIALTFLDASLGGAGVGEVRRQGGLARDAGGIVIRLGRLNRGRGVSVQRLRDGLEGHLGEREREHGKSKGQGPRHAQQGIAAKPFHASHLPAKGPRSLAATARDGARQFQKEANRRRAHFGSWGPHAHPERQLALLELLTQVDYLFRLQQLPKSNFFISRAAWALGQKNSAKSVTSFRSRRIPPCHNQ